MLRSLFEHIVLILVFGLVAEGNLPTALSSEETPAALTGASEPPSLTVDSAAQSTTDGKNAAKTESAKRTHFESHIRPLLIDKCQQCHGPEKQEGGLRLDSAAGWQKGGDSGPSIVPGDPESSLLFRAIRYDDPDRQMPPSGQLSSSQIRDVETWIRDGAFDPRESHQETIRHPRADPKTFWSFQPVRPVTPPAVRQQELVVNPIDAFVLHELEERKLHSAPQAEARTLIRRLSFDLLGLPPSSEQIESFVQDSSPKAWERLIDQFLESKQYGERWGRHWLDVARYADSGGYETDIYYRNAWRYRDYVVKSFNDDKPYSQFVQEQIAADEIWPDNIELNGTYQVPPEKLRHLEALIGTGLYSLSPQIHESNMDGRKILNETLSDWVDTTGAAFMGLTFGCSRCHDHKFDPLTQQDYYAMQAIFAGSRQVDVPVIPAMSVADYKQHYPRVLAVDEARRAYQLFEARTSGRDLTDAEKTEQQRLLEAIARAVLSLQAKTAQGEPFDGIYEIPSATVLSRTQPELVPKIFLLNRGELSRAGDQVGPGLPVSLAEASGREPTVSDSIGSRKALALWLTDPSHPLTARVMVNRIWYGHFGRGIVATLNDFGQMGERPSHPELLDWLAGEFVRSGWSVKAMHRLILQSRTWQQDSQYRNSLNEEIDPTNQYLWKMNRRRLEAEAIWDSIHSVAGTLNLKMGGRPVLPPLGPDENAPANWIVSADPSEHTRRGLYILQRRNFRFPMFDVFDLPVNAVSAPSREVTTVAPQALWMLNNPTVYRQASAFARRLRGDSGTGWNAADFGPGQPGWQGGKAGPHAGWAKRVATPNSTEGLDDPIGTVMTHGPSSVLWTVPKDVSGDVVISGGLWNLRQIGRSGTWKLLHNEQVLAEGSVNDQSGSSSKPAALFSAATEVNSQTRKIRCQPGDRFRLEILEDDFVGVNLTFTSSSGRFDVSDDFSLDSNPSLRGWTYAEASQHGGGPLSNSVRPETSLNDEQTVIRGWRIAVGRNPDSQELADSLHLLQSLSEPSTSASPAADISSASRPPSDAALTQFCLALMNLQEFLYVD
ncbi:MAG: PSD1 and planctomycete cytochrome C domain-containing protein [Planctomyces sp.]